MGKVHVFLSDEAAAQFAELARGRTFGALAKRCLKELEDFPPEAWGDVHRGGGRESFKSDNHLIFDIQGKLILDGEGRVRVVKVTRFRMRRGK